MKRFTAFLCAMLVANAALSQINYNIIKRQANNAANAAANASQSENQTQPPAAPAQPNKPPQQQPNPELQATLQNISNLKVDFDALGKLAELKSDSPQKNLLLKDLTIAPQGSKPTDASISALADSLSQAVASKAAMQPQHQKLAQDIHAIFNAGHLTADQQQKIFDDVQKILKDGGSTTDDVSNVVSHIKTIATETK